jgi:hypothetical protein
LIIIRVFEGLFFGLLAPKLLSSRQYMDLIRKCNFPPHPLPLSQRERGDKPKNLVYLPPLLSGEGEG